MKLLSPAIATSLDTVEAKSNLLLKAERLARQSLIFERERNMLAAIECERQLIEVRRRIARLRGGGKRCRR